MGNSDRVVLITGASSGIGAGVAAYLVEKEGYGRIALVARREDRYKAFFSFFSVIPGAQPLAYTIPHGPFPGGRTLDTSLRPGGGVGGCLGSKLWWGGGIRTPDLLHAGQESWP